MSETGDDQKPAKQPEVSPDRTPAQKASATIQLEEQGRQRTLGRRDFIVGLGTTLLGTALGIRGGSRERPRSKKPETPTKYEARSPEDLLKHAHQFELEDGDEATITGGLAVIVRKPTDLVEVKSWFEAGGTRHDVNKEPTRLPQERFTLVRGDGEHQYDLLAGKLSGTPDLDTPKETSPDRLLVVDMASVYGDIDFSKLSAQERTTLTEQAEQALLDLVHTHGDELYGKFDPGAETIDDVDEFAEINTTILP